MAGPTDRARLLGAIHAATAAMAPGDATTRFQKAIDRLGGLLAERALERRYNPDWASQPRVPSGNPDGGRWTDGGGTPSSDNPPLDAEPSGAERTQYAQSRSRPQRTITIGRNRIELTPYESSALYATGLARDAAVARVHEIEPNWRPRAQIFETARGAIEANRAVEREAVERFIELQGAGIGPGPFSGESIPARGPERNFRTGERDEINRIGSESGCHTCGTRNSGTQSGNFVPDHQQPSAINPSGRQQRLFPQCITCSRRQGARILNEWIKNR